MKVVPRSTATMISGLLLGSISVTYVYLGIKGIYRSCERGILGDKGRQASKQTSRNRMANGYVSAVLNSSRRQGSGK